ncbi:hypothetical protein VPAG_00048 [Vibrio phage douglas 12A4]|uniref:hypothetical protein n=1 Tax=Vibrio phage douglas 12A4 TaxID=573171 RepID=UPI0002C12E6F|nr:hypothetical protein VPAG_00048 [Vibrio phage douglas 12A4]AGG58084.1 hypothetical protein VPAG_00048 [Vibrio phage douglas 12A4]
MAVFGWLVILTIALASTFGIFIVVRISAGLGGKVGFIWVSPLIIAVVFWYLTINYVPFSISFN